MLYYGAGNAESNYLLLTFMCRPAKTVSLETWGSGGAVLNLPTCWAEMTESSGEGTVPGCSACVQQAGPVPWILTGEGPRVLWGALELSLTAPPELLGRAGADWHFLEEAIYASWREAGSPFH